jgi:phosphatidate phosphatase APP1
VSNADPASNCHTVVDDAWSGSQGYHFSGRLTKIRLAPDREGGRFHSLRRSARMLFSGGEEGAVSWRVGEMEWTTRADEKGYWEVAASQPLSFAPGWREIQAWPAASSAAGLYINDSRNTWGIISDIDDTVMVSHVFKTRRLLKNTLMLPAEQREAVPNMAALYLKIAQKNPSPECAPIFYVSSAPRQLTDNLRRFLQANGFPRGVLQLKEVSPRHRKALRSQEGYKRARLETIFKAYPGVKFTLVGDDGEHDPEIYATLQKEYPAQVTEIWIRKVHADRLRPKFPGQYEIVGPST